MIIVQSRPMKRKILNGPEEAHNVAHKCRDAIINQAMICQLHNTTSRGQSKEIVERMFLEIPTLGDEEYTAVEIPQKEPVLNYALGPIYHQCIKLTIPYTGCQEYLYTLDVKRYAGPELIALTNSKKITTSIHYERGMDSMVISSLKEFTRLSRIILSRTKSSLENDDMLGKSSVIDQVEKILEQRKKDIERTKNLLPQKPSS